MPDTRPEAVGMGEAIFVKALLPCQFVPDLGEAVTGCFDTTVVDEFRAFP
jgi:hypothetical protein